MKRKEIYTGCIDELKIYDKISLGFSDIYSVDDILDWGNNTVLLLRNIATHEVFTRTFSNSQYFA